MFQFFHPFLVLKNVLDVSGNSQIILYPGSVTVCFFNLVPRVSFLPFLSSGENGD